MQPDAEPSPNERVLSYASLGADGLPEWIPEAEALITSGGKLEALRVYFSDSAGLAAKYYAKSMRRRFAVDRVGEFCVRCGVAEPRWVMKLLWQIHVRPKSMSIELNPAANSSRFETAHAVCPACSAVVYKWFRRVHKVYIGYRVAYYALLGSAVVSAAGRPLFGKGWVTTTLSTTFFGMWAVFFLLLILRWAIHAVAIRRFPKVLRLSVSKFGILLGITDYWDRHANKSDSDIQPTLT